MEVYGLSREEYAARLNAPGATVNATTHHYVAREDGSTGPTRRETGALGHGNLI